MPLVGPYIAEQAQPVAKKVLGSGHMAEWPVEGWLLAVACVLCASGLLATSLCFESFYSFSNCEPPCIPFLSHSFPVVNGAVD